MKIEQIWRYPIKSMQGERMAAALVDEHGIEGDRVLAVKTANGRIASAKNAKRFGRLFECFASGSGQGVKVRLPSGEYAVGECEEALSAFLGEPVYVSGEPVEHTEIDYIDLDGNPLTFPPMPGAYFDTAPVHVLFTEEIEALRNHLGEANLDVRRFRPNLVIKGAACASGILKIGGVTLEIEGPCPRCIMTTLPQPGGVPRDVEILKTIARELSGNFGWLARVASQGTLHEGDVVAATS